MQNADTPKMWVEEDIMYDPETGEIIENTPTELAVVEEIPIPTITEQKELVASSPVSSESKGLLNSLIEMNSIAQTLELMHNNETQEQRKVVVTAMCEAFVNERMRNNIVAEELKRRLLERLIDNVEHLDLETTSRIYTDLHDVSNIDSQQAVTNINGGTGGISGNQTGPVFNLNLATGENSHVTNNTLNANPQQVGQLKEVVTLNSSIKAWSNIPLPKKKTIDADFSEK